MRYVSSCESSPGWRRRLLLPLAVLGCMAWLGDRPAAAQEAFRLGPDGTFVKQAEPDPASPEGRLQAARKARADGDFAEAGELAEAWIEEYPNHPLLPEAYLIKGDALVGQRDYYDALYDYEKVIRLYPQSEQFFPALEREYDIARLYAEGMKRPFLGLGILPAEDEAVEIFIRIQERAPGSELGEKASLTLADYYFKQGQMDNASKAYDLFLANYPRSQHREQAMRRLIEAQLATFKGPRYDARGLLDAQERIRMFAREFPAAAERMGLDALSVRLQESRARKLLLNAQWYERRDQKVSAVYSYRRTIKDFPATPAAQEALQRLVELGVMPPAAPRPEGGPAAQPPATRSAPPGAG